MRRTMLIAAVAASIPAIAMAQYGGGSYTAADRQLNQVYGGLMATLSPAGQRALRDQQRAWIAQRNRACGFEAQNACAAQWTRTRADELRTRLGRGKTASNSTIRERPGQCFATSVTGLGPRLEGAPDSGSSVQYADGHRMVDYGVSRAVGGWRRGDAITLCVVSLPQNCPPGDNRGIVYRATNRRAGSSWTAADSQHSCGGA